MIEKPDEYLIQDLRDALASDPRIGELGTTIRIVADDIYVEGVVATEERRIAIGEVLSRMLPESVVHNNVEVEAIHDDGSVEELA